MSGETRAVDEILSAFDKSAKKLVEYEIASAVEGHLKEEYNTGSVPNEFLWEKIAFEFCENYRDDKTGWGTYYGPMIVWNEEDGTASEYPSIRKLTPEILDYWGKRAFEVNHPILRARYSDLVWEFSRIVNNRNAEVQLAHVAIDSRIEIARHSLHEYETSTIEHLKRALALALSLKDTGRIEMVKDAVIAYESEVAEDDKLGLWGFSYDLLVCNRNVHLPADSEQKIIGELEDRFNRTCLPTDGMSLDKHRWHAKHALSRLLDYYRKRNEADEIKRIARKYCSAFRDLVEDSSPFLAYDWLQEVRWTQ